jgi:hypothetical protein
MYFLTQFYFTQFSCRFSSGRQLNDSSVAIHQFYTSKESLFVAQPPLHQPIHLLVDSAPHTNVTGPSGLPHMAIKVVGVAFLKQTNKLKGMIQKSACACVEWNLSVIIKICLIDPRHGCLLCTLEGWVKKCVFSWRVLQAYVLSQTPIATETLAQFHELPLQINTQTSDKTGG